MFFITNRKMKILGDHLLFDLRHSSPDHEVKFCLRQKKDHYSEVGSKQVMSSLKECEKKQLLFYIHGFNNFPEKDIFPRAENLQKIVGDEILVVPIIWPCGDRKIGIARDYMSDQKSADASGISFARALMKFLAWQDEENPCDKRMNVIAHSMGNRVLRETLCAWSKYDLPRGVPQIFRNVFMAAADVVNETLHRGERGELICHSAKNVVVFYAAGDMALRSSKAVNISNRIASRRLGHSGPEDIDKCPKNVFSFDCDDSIDRGKDKAGHSYFIDENSACCEIIKDFLK